MQTKVVNFPDWLELGVTKLLWKMKNVIVNIAAVYTAVELLSVFLWWRNLNVVGGMFNSDSTEYQTKNAAASQNFQKCLPRKCWRRAGIESYN